MKTMHSGVGVDGLISLIREKGNRGFVEADGKSLSDAEALDWLRSQRKAGIRLVSSCPTPRPDGGCPGHVKEGAA